MPKFLFQATYTTEGIQGLIRDSASAAGPMCKPLSRDSAEKSRRFTMHLARMMSS